MRRSMITIGLLVPLLGWVAAQAAIPPQRIDYHHSVEATLDHLRKDSVAVLMPAPDVDVVLKIAADDRLLPEKATSFQPKPSVGVLIRSLRDE